jgi:hypothetical protein
MADISLDRAATCSDRGQSAVIDDGEGPVNEDLACVTSTAAWVLDGATPVLDEHHTPAASDAAWYVEHLSHHIAGAIDSDDPLEDVVWEAIEATRREYESFVRRRTVDPAAEPSAAGVVVRWRSGTLEYLVLGDCSLTVRTEEEVSHVTDGRLAAQEEPILEDLESRLDAGETLSFARDAVWDQVQALRRRANAPDGYWVFGFDPTAAAHAATGTVRLNPGDDIVLSTDGFDRLVTTFDEHAYWGDLLDDVDERGLGGAIDRLRTLEADDPDAKSYTRFKRHDDATAAWLTFD